MQNSIDAQAFLKALKKQLANPIRGKDLYTEAAREVTGIPDLELTKEQRSQCKLLAHAVMYGAPIEFALTRPMNSKSSAS